MSLENLIRENKSRKLVEVPFSKEAKLSEVISLIERNFKTRFVGFKIRPDNYAFILEAD